MRQKSVISGIMIRMFRDARQLILARTGKSIPANNYTISSALTKVMGCQVGPE